MSDLRRSATEVKRDHDHKAKWARGARLHRAEKSGWDVDAAGPVRLRPELPRSSAATKRDNTSSYRSARHAVYTRFQHDVKEALNSDSSSDEVTHESHAADIQGAVAPDDALSVYAISGNTVLSSAVSTAEIKYETKVTEKLAKEYEFVSKEDEAAVGYVADVDDFEVIEHVAV